MNTKIALTKKDKEQLAQIIITAALMATEYKQTEFRGLKDPYTSKNIIQQAKAFATRIFQEK